MATDSSNGPTRPLRTVPGIGTEDAGRTIEMLQQRLVSLIDLELTLKHIHWNVTGPNFIAVHEMLDDFTASVRDMLDEAAERIRTLGGEALGRPGDVVSLRSWDDYSLVEASSEDHLRQLDTVFDGVILDHRRAMAHAANTDPVTEDLFIGQTAKLEMHQWFVRSFLRGMQPDAGAQSFGGADRRPTADEEQAAEKTGGVSDDVKEHYEEMATTGANARGEGRID